MAGLAELLQDLYNIPPQQPDAPPVITPPSLGDYPTPQFMPPELQEALQGEGLISSVIKALQGEFPTAQQQEDYAIEQINALFGYRPELKQYSPFPSTSWSDLGYGGYRPADDALLDYSEGPYTYDPRYSNRWIQYQADLAKQNRQDVYGDIREGVTDFYTDQLNRDKERSDRMRKFAFARRGTSFGSADLDSQLESDQIYDRGLGTIAVRGDTAVDRLRTEDERARLDLIKQIRGGMDVGDAFDRALSSLDTSRENTYNTAIGETFGNAFEGLDESLRYNQYLTGQQQGAAAYNTRSPFNFNYRPYYGS